MLKLAPLFFFSFVSDAVDYIQNVLSGDDKICHISLTSHLCVLLLVSETLSAAFIICASLGLGRPSPTRPP